MRHVKCTEGDTDSVHTTVEMLETTSLKRAAAFITSHTHRGYCVETFVTQRWDYYMATSRTLYTVLATYRMYERERHDLQVWMQRR